MAGGFGKFSLLWLRLAMGWLFFYAGITKILNPEWSAAGYLMNAKTFSSFYHILASPEYIGWIDIMNIWGLAIIGAMLILGLGVFLASLGGFLLMILYYLPILAFPIAGEHSYIVDEHIIYALVFLVFIGYSAGQHWGLDGWIWKSVLPSRRRL